MSSVGFQIKSKSSLKDIQTNINEQFSTAKYRRIMGAAAKIAYEEACKLCPVAPAIYEHSGRMKKAITVTYDGYLTFTLECNVPYASFNEFGWRGLNPPVPQPPNTILYESGYRPFMRIGILKAEKYINKHLGKALSDSNKTAHAY